MIPILLIIIITFIMNIKNPIRNSDELSEEETSTEDYVRTDYVDSEGNISFAGDKGYATVIKTKQDGHVVLEQYFDEKGQLTVLPAGYAQIFRVYEGDLNIEIIYLDIRNQPVVVSSGYDTIRRTYTEAGKADIDTYWIGDQQVRRKEGYWQYQISYDKSSRICEVRYLDLEGNPVRNTSGYALVRRTYIAPATIDMYFDEDLKPAASTLGQYGEMTETVDGTIITTYLDAAGEPDNTIRQDILNNIWLFVPIGAALYDPKHRLRWFWAVLLSVGIEVLQYFFGIGLCELDDVFSNGLGAIIGYVTAHGLGVFKRTLVAENYE